MAIKIRVNFFRNNNKKIYIIFLPPITLKSYSVVLRINKVKENFIHKL